MELCVMFEISHTIFLNHEMLREYINTKSPEINKLPITRRNGTFEGETNI